MVFIFSAGMSYYAIRSGGASDGVVAGLTASESGRKESYYYDNYDAVSPYSVASAKSGLQPQQLLHHAGNESSSCGFRPSDCSRNKSSEYDLRVSLIHQRLQQQQQQQQQQAKDCRYCSSPPSETARTVHC